MNGETSIPPGKITNETQTDVNDTQRQPRHGLDYAQINSYLWKFFHDTYDGGPKIILKGTEEELTVESPVPRNENDDNESIDETTVTSSKLPESVDEKQTKSVTEKSSTIMQQKTVKNVSFEDEDNHSAASTEMVEEVVPRVEVNSRERRRRMQHNTRSSNSTNSTNINIISKKDKRHCSGITTNGLFGPEGNLCVIFMHLRYISNAFHFLRYR